MKERFIRARTYRMLLGVLLLAPSQVFCQFSQPNSAGNAKRNAVPDISGVWSTPGFLHIEREQLPDIPVIGLTRFNRRDYPFRPGGDALWKRQFSQVPDPRVDDPQLLCLPWGFPHQSLLSNVQHFFQPEGYLVIFYEDMHYARVIPMDGREHVKGLAPNYYGHAVGKYEGDTAIVDTTGLKPWGLDDGGAVPDGNHMFTDEAHFIERFRRTGPSTMSYQLTIDDPKVFARPWTCGAKDSRCFVDGNRGPEEWIMRLHPEWEIIEQYCEENNKDPGLLRSLREK